MGKTTGWARAARIWSVLAGCLLTVACSATDDGRDDGRDDVRPALPTEINAPGEWSSDEGVSGPVAALGHATRMLRQGPLGEVESMETFTVSALDGRASWLDLPDHVLSRTYGDTIAVSPDGRWIGWVRNDDPFRSGRRWVGGYALMDTTTGEVRTLVDRRSPSGLLRPHESAEIAFSGDSRHLLTSYSLPGPGGRSSRGHQFVAWDVESAEPTVLEEPGEYWLPSLGSASSGVVWSRDTEVFRADPATGARTSVRLPQDVASVSWGPDDTAIAYTESGGGVWGLHVGATVEEAAAREVQLPADAPLGPLLGWKDATHVVVGHYRTWVHVVDVETGESERVDLAGEGQTFNAPRIATGLWQEPLRTPEPRTGTSDPRRFAWWASPLVIAALLAYVVGVTRPLRTSGTATRTSPRRP